MHVVIVGTYSDKYSIFNQHVGLAIWIDRLFLIHEESYLYASFSCFYQGSGNFFVGKDIHGDIYDGFCLIDMFYDFFLGMVVLGKVDFCFGEGGNGYSYGKDNNKKNKDAIFRISF